MTATVRWLVIIVGLLVGNALAMTFLIVASSTNRVHVIPNYYAKAVRHDDVIDEDRRNRALGWTIAVTPAASSLAVIVRDATGALLDGATVRATLVPRARAERRYELALREASSGRYVGHGVESSGFHDAELVVERAGHRFTQHALVELP